MKVLITGEVGFIGSHLAEKLLKLGYEVRVLDNLSSGSLEKLSQIMDEIEFVKEDCKKRRDVLNSMKDVEVVFPIVVFPLDPLVTLRCLVEDKMSKSKEHWFM